MTAIEKKLVNPQIKSGQDVLNFPPALDHQFAGIASAVAGADSRPTDSARVYYREVKASSTAILAELDGMLKKDLAEFNDAVRPQKIPPVVVLPAAGDRRAA